MTIDWAHSPDRVLFAHGLWEEGLSVKQIANRCSEVWHEEVSKNVIAGMKYRRHIEGITWSARSSPIIRDGSERADKPKVCLPPGGNALPSLDSLKEPPPAIRSEEPVAEPVTRAASFVRPEGAPLYRRDGSGCLATGCDGPLVSLSKPYCLDHSRLYYQKKSKQREEDEHNGV